MLVHIDDDIADNWEEVVRVLKERFWSDQQEEVNKGNFLAKRRKKEESLKELAHDV